MQPSPHLDRFIRTLHRRFVLLRAAERVGTCLIAGCGGAGLLLPLFWWRGANALPMVLLLLCISVLIGLLMAILRRPTSLQAAMEADRQLQLADLLSSALSIRHIQDSWGDTVRLLADARCRDLSPSQVLFNRWGARRWGGIGLAVTLVLTLALFSSQSAPSQAASESLSSNDDLGVLPPVSASIAYSPARLPSASRVSAPNDAPSATTDTMQTSDATENDKSASANTPSATPKSPSAGDSNGSGAGASGTSGLPSPSLPLSPSASKSTPMGQGPTATGGQTDSHPDAGQSGKPAPAGLAGANGQAPMAPPWSTLDWPSDQQKALNQIRSTPTYDPYRILIQKYFARSDARGATEGTKNTEVGTKKMR